MDISFKTESGRFNYRVSAVIIRDGCLLTMQDDIYPYSYLPGGRVKLHETAKQAIRREMQEELRANLAVLRPLWFCEDFFTEEATKERFHEICIYYLVDGEALPRENFILPEGDRVNRFTWTPIDALKDKYFYPEFLRDRISNLPRQLEMILEQK